MHRSGWHWHEQAPLPRVSQSTVPPGGSGVARRLTRPCTTPAGPYRRSEDTLRHRARRGQGGLAAAKRLHASRPLFRPESQRVFSVFLSEHTVRKVLSGQSLLFIHLQQRGDCGPLRHGPLQGSRVGIVEQWRVPRSAHAALKALDCTPPLRAILPSLHVHRARQGR